VNDPRKELINVIVTNVLLTAASQITTIAIGEAYEFIKRKTAPSPEKAEPELEEEEETVEIEEEVIEEVPTKKKSKKKKSLT
jgi:hypothetical protein